VAPPFLDQKESERADRNWTQADRAQRLETSRNSMNAFETGKYGPSLPLTFRIAELVELRVEEGF